jgi:sugar (pentulose or hexulose) kinase
MLSTLTVDVGTTSVKLSVFAAGGDLLASARSATPTAADADGEHYDTVALCRLLTEFVGRLDAPQRAGLRRIAITGVGESGGLVRSDLRLASPMILWHDQRGAAALARVSDVDRHRLWRITGLPVNANYGLSKAAWAIASTAGTAPDAHWLNIAEYLAARLTGERWSEPSLASRTMALDVSTGTWSAEAAGILGVDIATFPPLRPAAEGVPLRPDIARDLDLDPEVRVHVAGHDHMVGAVGAELLPGELLNSTGTTEGLLVRREEPALDPASERAKLANGIDVTGIGRTLFASIPTGGSAFATLQALLGSSAAALADRTEATALAWREGRIDLGRVPLVLPRFRGSPPPEKRASARGVITGLADDTTLDELLVGAFLGLARQFADVLELFPARPERLKVIGPASRNPLWLQLKADLLGMPLAVSGFPEVVSRGAQALASGETARWEDCAPRQVDPDPARQARVAAWWGDNEPRWRWMQEFPG